MTAVTRITVSPYRIITEPFACPVKSVNSAVSVFPPNSILNDCVCIIVAVLRVRSGSRFQCDTVQFAVTQSLKSTYQSSPDLITV